ncbi:MAG: hypothetical protein HEQ19_08890 [Gloeotrichia echinulata CP02]
MCGSINIRLYLLSRWSFVICHLSFVICHLSFVIGYLSNSKLLTAHCDGALRRISEFLAKN